MIFYIKNMVCIRCQMVVKHELENLGLFCLRVEIGWVEVEGTVSAVDMMKFKMALLGSGLELIYDKKSILIEKIKNTISEMVNSSDDPLKINFSYYLSDKLNLDYTYLANIFSEHQGITIERFIIMNKIQKVKELICYNELNLTEISWKLHYSSVAHLSTQFKKITGITPSYYRHLECSSPVII